MKKTNILLVLILISLTALANSSEVSKKHDNRNSYLELSLSIGGSTESIKSYESIGYTELSLVPIFRSFPISPIVYMRFGSGDGLTIGGGWGVRYTHSSDVHIQASMGSYTSHTDLFSNGGDSWKGDKYRLSYYRYFPESTRLSWNVSVLLDKVTQTDCDECISNVDRTKSHLGVGLGITFVLF